MKWTKIESVVEWFLKMSLKVESFLFESFILRKIVETKFLLKAEIFNPIPHNSFEIGIKKIGFLLFSTNYFLGSNPTGSTYIFTLHFHPPFPLPRPLTVFFFHLFYLIEEALNYTLHFIRVIYVRVSCVGRVWFIFFFQKDSIHPSGWKCSFQLENLCPRAVLNQVLSRFPF